MSVHSLPVLYLSMTLVIVGNGFFKPNISTLLGTVYTTPEHNHQKDEGYNIFYMGINVGAFICNFFGAVLYNTLRWGYAFAAAGNGMFLGVIIFLIGTRHYKAYDVKKGMKEGDMSMLRITGLILFPSVIAGVLGWFLPGNIFGSDSTDAFIFACIPVILFYASLYFRAQKEDKAPVGVLLIIFAVVVMFWAVFKQNGSALNTWADRYTDRSVTGTTEQLFGAVQLTQTLKYQKDSVALYDEQFRLQKKDGQVVKEWNYPLYFRNDASSNMQTEGGTLSVWSTNLSQSINPGWVILLTPLVVAFFTWLRRKGKEPGTPTKIAFGLLISALSVLVMVAASKAGNNGAEKVSMWWLIASYGVITVGELLLSPMGLSLVSKLSPAHITSLMMGGWFLATSIGNKLSGILASMWDRYEDKSNFFWLNFVLLLAAAGVLFLLLKQLNKVMKERGIV